MVRIFAVFLLFIFAIAAAWLANAPTLAPSASSKLASLVRLHDVSPEVQAEAVIVERLGDQKILYEKNSDRKLPIASLTKLMTARIFAKAADPLWWVTFSKEAKTAGDNQDERSLVKPDDALKAEDVLKLMLIASDNDAAYAAAEWTVRREHVELDAAVFQDRIRGFVSEMNAEAQALGLLHTHYANPNGTDDPENYSSAEDLARLAERIFKEQPELWTISRTEETTVVTKYGDRLLAKNTDPLVEEFPAIYGSKTGLEQEAKGALLLLYQLAPRDPAAIVILRSPDRFADGRGLIQWLELNFMLESRK